MMKSIAFFFSIPHDAGGPGERAMTRELIAGDGL